MKKVYVFSDNYEKMSEAFACAKTLSSDIESFVFNEDQAKMAFSYGAKIAHLIKLDENDIIENHTKEISSLIKENSIVIFGATKIGKALAALLSVELNAGLITEAFDVTLDENIKAKHLSYGGLCASEEEISSNIAIIALANAAYESFESDENQNGEIKEVALSEQKLITLLGKKEKEKSKIDLSKAKKIVAIGRGIINKEDMALAQNFCDLINAELGCTRPIVEAEKWLEHERYIGISSVMAKPELYVSIGISGQIQHMVGVKDSSIIIAINKDKNAPIFDYADYGIVGDLYKILPVLNEKLK